MLSITDGVPSPFDPFDRMSFSNQQCFLCGKFLLEDTTREHVIPKWLLNRFDLWDRKLNLINNTSIAYRYLTIPCCSGCNSIFLSRIESVVETAVNHGPEAVARVGEHTIYLWLGKIFYGLLFRDLSLILDRKEINSGYLSDPAYMQNYRALHGFLQSSRLLIEFKDFSPGSIFIFNIEQKPEFEPFDFSDNPIGMTICIRMGNVGIIACLKDDGLIKADLDKMYNVTKGKLLQPMTPVQKRSDKLYPNYTLLKKRKL